MSKRPLKAGLILSILISAAIVCLSVAPPLVRTADSPDPASSISGQATRYGALFDLVVELENQADVAELEGENGDSLRGYVRNEASLSEYEAAKLRKIAHQCFDAVSRQDEKATTIIEEFRSQFPGGKIPVGTNLPPPPPELKVLQNGRNEIILSAWYRLRLELGQTGFDKVSRFASKNITLRTNSTPRN